MKFGRIQATQFMLNLEMLNNVPVLYVWVLAQWGFPGGSDDKEYACNVKIQVQSLGREEPLEKGTATHSSILS